MVSQSYYVTNRSLVPIFRGFFSVFHEIMYKLNTHLPYDPNHVLTARNALEQFFHEFVKDEDARVFYQKFPKHCWVAAVSAFFENSPGIYISYLPDRDLDYVMSIFQKDYAFIGSYIVNTLLFLAPQTPVTFPNRMKGSLAVVPYITRQFDKTLFKKLIDMIPLIISIGEIRTYPIIHQMNFLVEFEESMEYYKQKIKPLVDDEMGLFKSCVPKIEHPMYLSVVERFHKNMKQFQKNVIEKKPNYASIFDNEMVPIILFHEVSVFWAEKFSLQTIVRLLV